MIISLDEFLQGNFSLENKVIVFPTDTVYGIGTSCKDFNGIDKIYSIKERSIDKAIPILISKLSDLDNLVEIEQNNKDYIYSLLEKYWPGAVTFIFKKKKTFDYPVDTLAIRMPDSMISLKIIDKYGPLSVTSMNKSGSEPLTDVYKINDSFKDVDFIISDTQEFSNVSSTICSLVDGLKILRQGTVEIKEVSHEKY